MSRLRIVLRLGEKQRRLENSVRYAELLFNTQKSPVLVDRDACVQFVGDVVAQAAPDAVLVKAIELNTPARRDALRHARLPRGDVGFVSVGLQLVMNELRRASLTFRV